MAIRAACAARRGSGRARRDDRALIRVDWNVSITVSGLFYYPVKSCAGTSLSVARLGANGIEGDRSFMIVTENGEFVTQRERPRLALVTPALDANGLTLAAPGMPELDVAFDGNRPRRSVVVWGDVVDAHDLGDDVASWISDYVGAGCRLVHMPSSATRAAGPVRGLDHSDTFGMAF